MSAWNIVLWVALASGAAAVWAQATAVRGDRRAEDWSRWLTWVTALLLGASFLWLLTRFIVADVGYQYVFFYTSDQIPLAYRIAGTWTGREGSLLLWAALLALAAALLARSHRRAPTTSSIERRARLWTRLVLLVVLGAFLVAVARQGTFDATDPALLSGRPGGNGLNPTLLNPYILIHPPMMFVAYALTAIPLAAVTAHMITGTDRWSRVALTWARFDWVLYTVAMGLGGLWAYYTLGFGGYWAWDPVEVANLLPWLALTIYLHAQLHHFQFGSYRTVGPLLGILPFVFTLFSTLSTRSGLWVSVHAFTDPTNAFEPDAAARLLNILEADPSLVPLAGLMLAVLFGGLALWTRRTALDEGVQVRTSQVVAGLLGAIAAVALVAPVTLLSLLFTAGSVIAFGHAGIGAMVVLLLLGLAAAWPALAATEEDGDAEGEAPAAAEPAEAAQAPEVAEAAAAAGEGQAPETPGQDRRGLDAQPRDEASVDAPADQEPDLEVDSEDVPDPDGQGGDAPGPDGQEDAAPGLDAPKGDDPSKRSDGRTGSSAGRPERGSWSLPVNLRTLLYGSVLVLSLALVVATLWHLAAVNGWDRAFWEARVPWLATPIALLLVVMLLHTQRGRTFALWCAALAFAAGLAGYLAVGLGGYALVVAAATLLAAIDKMQSVCFRGAATARIGSLLLWLAAVLDLVFWLDPPPVPLLGWTPVWPVQAGMGALAVVALVGAHRVGVGATRRLWPYLLAAVLGAYYVAPVLAVLAWLVHRADKPTRKKAVGPRWRPIGVYGVHFAIAMLFVGYAASTYFDDQAEAELGLGENLRVGPWDLTFIGAESSREPDTPWAAEVRPTFAVDHGERADAHGTLYWETQNRAHFPLPGTQRTAWGELYVSIDAVCIDPEGDCDATTDWVTAFERSPRIADGASITAVKAEVLWLPGISLVWAPLALFGFYGIAMTVAGVPGPDRPRPTRKSP